MPRFWRRHRYTILAALVLLALALPQFKRRDDWVTVYLPAAQALRAGHNFYDAVPSFSYPPAMVLLPVPFSFLALHPACLAWYLVNALALIVLWRASWRLSRGRPLQGEQPTAWREHLVLLLGLLVGFRFVTDCLDHQQTDLLIGALVLAGAALLARRRPLLAAALLGAAAGLKATAALWLLYFLWRRRWAAAALFLAVAVFLNFLPDLFYPAPGGGWWLHLWLHDRLLPNVGSSAPVGVWFTAPIFNQSLAGTARRLLVLGFLHDQPRPGAVSEQALKTIVHLADAALLGLSAFAFWRARRGAPPGCDNFRGQGATGRMRSLRSSRPVLLPEDSRGLPAPPADDPILPLEAGTLLMLMVLLSPASSKPHFLTVFLPALILARLALLRRHRFAAACLAAALVASLLSNRSLVGKPLGDYAQWLGGITWCALALWAGCVWALARPRPIDL